MTATGVGIVGCGTISHAYAGTIARAADLSLVGLASRTMAAAERQAACYGGEAMGVDALLADPRIAIVVNLTPPALHQEIGRSVLAAGKHLYNEKPFATTLAEADDLLALAAASGLSAGCAPDTFLGPAHQAARRLIDDGAIGAVTHGEIAFATGGMEGWHPDPAPFYACGGGPLLDIGPYYLTLLVALLGPIAEVTAIGSRPRSTRRVRGGGSIAVEVFTTVAGALSFASGATVALSLSWDSPGDPRAHVALHGERGTLQTADPNHFTGQVRWRSGEGDWRTVGDAPPPRALDVTAIAAAVAMVGRGIDPVTGGAVTPDTPLRFRDRRGLGVREMAAAIRAGRPPRASGALAAHVLEALLALERSAQGAGRVVVGSRVPRPHALPEPLDD